MVPFELYSCNERILHVQAQLPKLITSSESIELIHRSSGSRDTHLVGKRVWWIYMYMDGVDLVAKERYKQKLESVGLLLSEDPYLESNSHRFSDDMSLWPRIESMGIF